MNLELHETVLNQLYLRKGVHMIHEGSLHTTSANHDNEQWGSDKFPQYSKLIFCTKTLKLWIKVKLLMTWALCK